MTNTYQYINLEYLYNISDGDQGFISEMIQDYRDRTPEYYDSLRQAASARDYEATRFNAHKLKSTFQFIGAAELADIVAELENSDDASLDSILEAKLERLQAVMALVNVELDSELAKIS